MTPTHHLPQSVLMAYATGALPEALNLAVATHVSMCDSSRAALGAVEAVGGHLLDDCAPVEMGNDSLTTALQAISAAPTPARATPRPSDVPAPLNEYLPGGYDDLPWRNVGGGVKQHVLRTGGTGSVRLLRIPGGIDVPEHSHRGLELTLVLQGAFADEDDSFYPGDIEVADDDVEHTPVALPGPDCICLAATEGALRFKGVMPRLVQPFIRI